MKAKIWKTMIRAEKSYNFQECSMGNIEHIIISLHLHCSGGLHGPSSDSNTMGNKIICNIYNVPEAFMDPSGASNTMENNIRSLHLQCSGGLHGPSSDSNTMENIVTLLCV